MKSFKWKLLWIASLLCLWFWLSPGQTRAIFKPDRSYYEPQGKIIWDIPTEEKIVALTFDDGPSSTYTPAILDILKKYHAKATFFLIGKHMKEFPYIVKREVEEGHEIENHTFTHIKVTKMPDKEFIKDIDKSEDIIQHYQKSTVAFFRPPGGALNKHIIESLSNKNYRIVLWSWHQDPRDWAKPGVNYIVKHTINNIHNGDIIIMHDAGGDRSQTVRALNIIIPTLQSQGYSFLTVKELVKRNPRYNKLFEKEYPFFNQMLPNNQKKQDCLCP